MRDLLDSSNVIFARVNTQHGEFGEREFDTRIKERPTKCDLNNFNLTITKLMEQHQVSQGRTRSVICGLRTVYFTRL